MNNPTPEQITKAVEHLSKSVRAQLCLECEPALETLITAYQAEKERLDWLLKNYWKDGTMIPIHTAKSFDGARSSIDQLRKDSK